VRWGILLGLLLDCTSLDPLGTHAFVLGAVTFLFCRRSGSSRGVTGALVPLTVAAATVVARVLSVVRCLPLHRDFAVADPLLAAFPTALWTALASWPLLALLDKTRAVDDLTGRRAYREAA
jgi:cell shape-determining protein MreD